MLDARDFMEKDCLDYDEVYSLGETLETVMLIVVIAYARG